MLSPALLVLAHQGGWDEALFVLAPLLLLGGLLVMARRRADRMAAALEKENDRTDGAGGSGGAGP